MKTKKRVVPFVSRAVRNFYLYIRIHNHANQFRQSKKSKLVQMRMILVPIPWISTADIEVPWSSHLAIINSGISV